MNMVDDAPAHDADLAAWCATQGRLLRAGRLSELDAIPLADELSSMLAAEDRLLRQHFQAILTALLLWAYDADLRCHARVVDVARARDSVAALLAASPSLGADLEGLVAEVYPKAMREAEVRIGWLVSGTLPAGSPFTLDEILDANSLPDPLNVDGDRGVDWWKAR
jgi:Domain of unknown function DUF29